MIWRLLLRNNIQNDPKQKKTNGNQLAAEMSRKISLQASNVILEQPSPTPPSSPPYQVYANIIGKKILYNNLTWFSNSFYAYMKAWNILWRISFRLRLK